MFIATSLDGFIARPDSDLDWLTERRTDLGHQEITSGRTTIGWEEFISSVDHIVMGRGTYEKALTFDRWPYSEKQVIVLSGGLDGTDSRITVSRSLAETMELLSRRGARSVYIDGGKTVQAFLRADLIDEITITVAPVLIGHGIPLFAGRLDHDVHLRLLASHTSAGMTHTTYEVVRDS